MWQFKQPLTATRAAALAYITVGALAGVWAGVWYVYLYNNPPEMHGAYYWCAGFLVTALTLVAIGLGLTLIDRSIQRAALPPQAVPFVAVPSQPGVAAPAPLLAVPSSNGILVTPDGQVVVPPPQSR